MEIQKLDDLGFKWSSITGKSKRIATNSAESAKSNDKSDSQQPLADSVNEESCKLENSSKLDEGAVTNPGDDDDMREVVVHEEKTDVSAHSALTELVSEDVNSKSFAEPSLKESVKDESAERSTIEV